MTRLRQTFQALGNRNFRLYFAGQAISTTGTWTQKVGQAWLVLELTDSGTLLGVTLALQHAPTLLAGAWGGLLADRMDKRRILVWTQGLAGLLALALGVLTATGLVQLWMILLLALGLGATHALDKPTRQAFVMEMVGPRQLMNAITLNSVLTNAGRTLGPAVAGLLIGGIGIAASFILNSATYGAVVVSLLLMRPRELEAGPPAQRGPGQLREGFRYVAATPRLLAPLVLMAVAGTLAYEWTVTIPLLARDVLGGGPETFGLMFSAMGLGAVLGGLAIAGSMRSSMGAFIQTAAVFSVVVVLTAIAPSLPSMLAMLFLLGASSIAFRSVGTTRIQLDSIPAMRGRVMALMTIAFAGSTPIGAPLAGWVGETYGARVALGMGGVGTAIATLAAVLYLRTADNRGRLPGEGTVAGLGTPVEPIPGIEGGDARAPVAQPGHARSAVGRARHD